MNEQNARTLQLFYAAALVDSVVNYEEHGALETVTARKRKEQEAAAPAQLARLCIDAPAEVFRLFGEIFGCAAWEIVSDSDERTEARAASCMLCAIARQRGAASPCRLFCINPFSGFAKALGRELTVEETLWTGDECRFVMR